MWASLILSGITGAGTACTSSLSSTHLRTSSGHRWEAKTWNPATKKQEYIGCYGTETEAANAYDKVALSRGKSTNLPPFGPAGQALKKPPLKVSKYKGVSWHTKAQK